MKPNTSKTDYRAFFLSILAATVFWIMNALNKDGYSQKISFPLRFTYNDSLYIPTQPLPEKITVHVTGNGWSLLRKALALDVAPVYYSINKPLKTKFLNTGSLADSLSDYIKDVRVNYVVTDRFELEFDKKVKRIIRLRVDSLSIPLQERYIVSSVINLNPSTIEVEGPESTLNELGEILSVKVPGRRIQDNYDDEIRIPLPKNSYLKANKERVSVSFEVAELLK